MHTLLKCNRGKTGRVSRDGGHCWMQCAYYTWESVFVCVYMHVDVGIVSTVKNTLVSELNDEGGGV